MSIARNVCYIFVFINSILAIVDDNSILDTEIDRKQESHTKLRKQLIRLIVLGIVRLVFSYVNDIDATLYIFLG